MNEIDDRDKPGPGKAAAASRLARDSVRGSHDGRDGADGIAVRDFPAGPEPGISRPGTAPAYYLGRPARLWITVMRPRRRRSESDHPVQAVTGGGKQAHHGTAAGRKIRSPLIPAGSSPHPTTWPAGDRCEMTWPVPVTGPWSPPASRYGPAGPAETQDRPPSEPSRVRTRRTG